MKKVYFLLTFILMLTGCVEPEDSPLSVSKITYTPIPVEPFISNTTLPIPTATPGLNNDPMDAVGLVLSDYCTVFTEDYAGIDANSASGFSKANNTQLSEDGASYQFTSRSEETVFSMLKLTESFQNANAGENRAVLIKFMPSKCNSVQFIISGLNQHEIRFDYGGNPILGNETPFSGEYPTTFRMEMNKSYYILIAVDKDSNLRCEIWEDGAAEEMAYYARGYENGGEITDAGHLDWELKIMLEPGEWVKLEQYWILSFEEYVK